MKRQKRIPRHVIHSFLYLASAAFTLGAGIPGAQAADTAAPDRQEEAVDEAGRAYLHSFPLQGPARISLLDADGREQARLRLHGANILGPLAHGAYTLLITSVGQTDTYRLRIGPDTLPYLHFTEVV